MMSRHRENTEYVTSYLSKGKKQLGKGNYEVVEAKTINVLLIGRSMTGKSSIVSTLIDPQTSVITTGLSTTKNPFFHSLVVYDKKTQLTYQLNVFDTPGLNEVRQANEQIRKNEDILDLIDTFVKYEVTYLNLVCLVTPAGETNLLDINVFDLILSKLGKGFSKICAIVLTKCDNWEDDKLDKVFIKNIRNHPDTKKIIEYCQSGIIKFCAINIETIEGMADSSDPKFLEDLLVHNLKRVEQMRNDFLREVIKHSDSPVELTIVNNYLEQEKSNIVDSGVQEIEQKLTNYMDSVASVKKSPESRQTKDKDLEDKTRMYAQ